MLDSTKLTFATQIDLRTLSLMLFRKLSSTSIVKFFSSIVACPSRIPRVPCNSMVAKAETESKDKRVISFTRGTRRVTSSALQDCHFLR